MLFILARLAAVVSPGQAPKINLFVRKYDSGNPGFGPGYYAIGQ
jgi:hypothetical protein